MSRKIFGLIALTAAIAQIKAPTMFLWDTLIGTEKTERTQKFIKSARKCYWLDN